MPRTRGIELFVRDTVSEDDSFPQIEEEQESEVMVERREERSECHVTILNRSGITQTAYGFGLRSEVKSVCRRGHLK